MIVVREARWLEDSGESLRDPADNGVDRFGHETKGESAISGDELGRRQSRSTASRWNRSMSRRLLFIALFLSALLGCNSLDDPRVECRCAREMDVGRRDSAAGRTRPSLDLPRLPRIPGFDADLWVGAKEPFTYIHRSTGLAFRLLRGGEFEMGVDARETPPDCVPTSPQHPVRLTPYLICIRELSQDTWTRVMGWNESVFRKTGGVLTNVSWDDCQEFCRRTDLRIPTEAQWEFACRSGTRGDFSSGDRLIHEWDAAALAPTWEGGQAGFSFGTRFPRPGGGGRNAFDLQDMHGNVSEWCADEYGLDFYSRPEAYGPDPLSTNGLGKRMHRGGSYLSPMESCSSWARSVAPSHWRVAFIGFRPAYYPLPESVTRYFEENPHP
jgi:hypothetical protein